MICKCCRRLFFLRWRSRAAADSEVTARVSAILEDVRTRGDRALFDAMYKFDRVKLTSGTVRLSAAELRAAAQKCPAKLKKAIDEAAKRIDQFHRKQGIPSFTLAIPGGSLQQVVRPLNRVAVYIPGGHTVYPSSVLMNVIPAKIAGVPQIVAVTPPRRGMDPGIAYALKTCGVTEIYRIGGAQAIAALAYGTKSIPAVDKVVGPGNAYVQTAKRVLYGVIDIDSVAGPSEVVIMADRSAKATWVALDLLAQAEHGSGDEMAVCVTEDPGFAREIAAETMSQVRISEVRATLEKLPKNAITIVVAKSRDESIEFVNRIAPEHLQIMTASCARDVKKIRNAAAVFLGQFTPVALGDYFIGTNHVLPTGGAARFWSPLGVDSFLKRMSVHR